MTDDQPKTFPNSVKLAMHYQEMITIRSFLEWAAADGVLLGQNCSTGLDLAFEPLGELTEATILRAFDIDLDELTPEAPGQEYWCEIESSFMTIHYTDASGRSGSLVAPA